MSRSSSTVSIHSALSQQSADEKEEVEGIKVTPDRYIAVASRDMATHYALRSKEGRPYIDEIEKNWREANVATQTLCQGIFYQLYKSAEKAETTDEAAIWHKEIFMLEMGALIRFTEDPDNLKPASDTPADNKPDQKALCDSVQKLIDYVQKVFSITLRSWVLETLQADVQKKNNPEPDKSEPKSSPMSWLRNQFKR
jgi:hypothetical protein